MKQETATLSPRTVSVGVNPHSRSRLRDRSTSNGLRDARVGRVGMAWVWGGKRRKGKRRKEKKREEKRRREKWWVFLCSFSLFTYYVRVVARGKRRTLRRLRASFFGPGVGAPIHQQVYITRRAEGRRSFSALCSIS